MTELIHIDLTDGLSPVRTIALDMKLDRALKSLLKELEAIPTFFCSPEDRKTLEALRKIYYSS